MASTLPTVIAPILGSTVIVVAGGLGQMAFGYRGVFALATIFLLLGAGFVLKIRESVGTEVESQESAMAAMSDEPVTEENVTLVRS